MVFYDFVVGCLVLVYVVWLVFVFVVEYCLVVGR